MPYVTRPGQPTLYYELDDYTDPWRQAPFIFLHHGFSRHSLFWHSWIPYLSRHYRVLRADMRGFGQSTEGFDAADVSGRTGGARSVCVEATLVGDKPAGVVQARRTARLTAARARVGRREIERARRTERADPAR